MRIQLSVPTVVLATVAALAVLAAGPASAQTPNATWEPPRTADGQPDIQGLWNNIDAFFVPFERPRELDGREEVSAVELQEVLEAQAEQKVAAADSGTGAGPLHWYEFGATEQPGTSPSLVVDPAEGRLPSLTPFGSQRREYNQVHRHDAAETIAPSDRCVSRGLMGKMLPTFYNNGKMILQTPGYVVIFSEMIHNARIIPLDGRPRIDDDIRLWEGDARGRWEGNTLVVETTNYRDMGEMRGSDLHSEELRTVERFTVVDAETIAYEARVDDPKTFTDAWTVAFPFKRDPSYQIFEYACHEANYSVPHMLSGARADEAKAAAGR
ncbi:MAG: hypothetical protein OXF27_03330 [Acidobacteria bacterium]|nr:hypothetical protein [Acidobacteriota bacterium]